MHRVLELVDCTLPLAISGDKNLRCDLRLTLLGREIAVLRVLSGCVSFWAPLVGYRILNIARVEKP